MHEDLPYQRFHGLHVLVTGTPLDDRRKTSGYVVDSDCCSIVLRDFRSRDRCTTLLTLGEHQPGSGDTTMRIYTCAIQSVEGYASSHK